MKTLPLAMLFSALLLLPLAPAGAASLETQRVIGNYRVLYNAFPSDTLSPAAANRYGIERSAHRILLNVEVQKRAEAGAKGPDIIDGYRPVAARMSATVVNMNRQLRNVGMKEVKDGAAYYYFGDFPVSPGQEQLRFNVTIRPHGEKQPFHVRFNRQFNISDY